MMSTCKDPSESKNTVTKFFHAEDAVLNFFYFGEFAGCHSICCLFVSDSKWCSQDSSTLTVLARKLSLQLLYCSKHSLRTVFRVSLRAAVNIFRTHLAQTFFNCNCFNILHTLASPTTTRSYNSFTVTHLSTKSRMIMRCTFSGFLCIVRFVAARKILNVNMPQWHMYHIRKVSTAYSNKITFNSVF